MTVVRPGEGGKEFILSWKSDIDGQPCSLELTQDIIMTLPLGLRYQISETVNENPMTGDSVPSD